MTTQNRRSFLKTSAALGAAATGLSAAPAAAAPRNVLSPDRMGVLVDTTVCIGCRQCEWACKTAHDLPTPPLESYEDPAPFAAMRRPDETALTVVNRYDNPKAPEVPTTVKDWIMKTLEQLVEAYGLEWETFADTLEEMDQAAFAALLTRAKRQALAVSKIDTPNMFESVVTVHPCRTSKRTLTITPSVLPYGDKNMPPMQQNNSIEDFFKGSRMDDGMTILCNHCRDALFFS